VRQPLPFAGGLPLPGTAIVVPGPPVVDPDNIPMALPPDLSRCIAASLPTGPPSYLLHSAYAAPRSGAARRAGDSSGALTPRTAAMLGTGDEGPRAPPASARPSYDLGSRPLPPPHGARPRSRLAITSAALAAAAAVSMSPVGATRAAQPLAQQPAAAGESTITAGTTAPAVAAVTAVAAPSAVPAVAPPTLLPPDLFAAPAVSAASEDDTQGSGGDQNGPAFGVRRLPSPGAPGASGGARALAAARDVHIRLSRSTPSFQLNMHSRLTPIPEHAEGAPGGDRLLVHPTLLVTTAPALSSAAVSSSTDTRPLLSSRSDALPSLQHGTPGAADFPTSHPDLPAPGLVGSDLRVPSSPSPTGAPSAGLRPLLAPAAQPPDASASSSSFAT